MSQEVDSKMIGKPDSQQRGLAGEYYVAFSLSRLGYDIAFTIGRAKILDMVALAHSGKTVKIQIKSTYQGYDWLVKTFDSSTNLIVALVRLGKDATQKPELYFLRGYKANKLISYKYKNHSPRISRAKVLREVKDHDFGLIKELLGD